MNQNLNPATQSIFESIKRLDANDTEYWSARELAEALNYSWEGFEGVIARAKVSVKQTGQPVESHFRHVSKMATIGLGKTRTIVDIELTRYACYIAAQNGNAAIKPKIAEANAYFATQTRKQELAEQREADFQRLVARQKYSESDKKMTQALHYKGIEGEAIGRIKGSGDKELYGGKTTSQMKKRYEIDDPNKPLADKTPSVVLAAKSLANEMTSTNLANLPIDTFSDIKEENDGNNKVLRGALADRGFTPEDMPAEEDTAIIMKRIKDEDNRRALLEQQDQ